MVGFVPPTPQIMEAWTKWFKSIEDKIEEQVGLHRGKEVTKSGTITLPLDLHALTGYLVINVENEDEAEKIARSCPMITSVQVFEVWSH